MSFPLLMSGKFLCRIKKGLCDLVPHVITVLALLVVILVIGSKAAATSKLGDPPYEVDPLERYGLWRTICLYFVRFSIFLTLPLSIFNFLGLVLYDIYPGAPEFKGTCGNGPLICFRVVTKGTCPDLVKRNVERNFNICNGLGLSNFIFEIVTDRFIGLPRSPSLREIVVPVNYRTAKKTLFKARALQYCLEDSVNDLKDEDWIVHLDEETILTRGSVIGILNFIAKGTSSFGQGVITYANEEIVCWITTIFDLSRVGNDYGIIRFCLKYFRKPLFSWKGSYVVSNVGAERNVSFDFGIHGSIAEDCFFGLVAWNKGYSFDFIEGEMWERSPFSLTDYVKQRRRWVQGITLTLFSKDIPFKQKIGISFSLLSWITMPLTASNSVLAFLYPLPMPIVFHFLCAFMGGVMMFLFIIGALKSFNYKRTGLCKFLLICLASVLLLPCFVLTETCAVVYAFLTFSTIEFHTIKKECRPSDKDFIYGGQNTICNV